MSDPFLIPEIAPCIARELNKLKSGSKVAWLGQLHPLVESNIPMYQQIMSEVDVKINSDFYDLHNDEKAAANSHVWDVNTEWDLNNYDAIVAVRIFYACESANQLLTNIKNCIQSGQIVIADFMSGNSQHYVHDKSGQRQYYSAITDGCELFTKPSHSKAILPMFPSAWEQFNVKSVLGNYEYGVKPNHDDQVVSEQDLIDRNISFSWIHVFREPTKHRIYSICEFANEP